ncbi:interleukin-22 receptor subunit alpha-2-like isoform X2 [Hemitrygon akajei]|uniref:interleukin-22 receptor subunit alpha-2-like isoform X2 n=1 Tax=Hemitrygon akajei TaxID=2704970 RepID=UPI003BF9E05C
MWLCWILVLITASVGSFALTELPGPIQVEFNSSNFKHVLHWKPGGPENSTYIVEYQMYGYAWQHKPECSRISTLSCDLTDAITEDNLYYARVMAVGTDANSTWSKSEQFNPFTETVIGAPAVKYTASTRSFNVWAEPPTIPPAGGIPRSIQEIFHEVEYNLQVVHSATNQKVFFASNKSGNFTVTPLEPSIEYCGSVNLLLKKGVVLKKSQTVVFCTKTEQEWTLMVILPAAALILLVVLIVGTFIWMAYSYTRHHRSLPRALF